MKRVIRSDSSLPKYKSFDEYMEEIQEAGYDISDDNDVDMAAREYLGLSGDTLDRFMHKYYMSQFYMRCVKLYEKIIELS